MNGLRHATLFMLLAGTFFYPATASSGFKTRSLSKKNVTVFIQQPTAILSGHSTGMDESDIKSYLDKHLHSDSRFKSTMRYAVPGFPSQQSAMVLNKTQFMDSIAVGKTELEEYEASVEILDIKISKNKRSATVKTRGEDAAVMAVKNNDGSSENVDLRGQSTCTQILMLSKRGVIQMYNAACETVINFMGL